MASLATAKFCVINTFNFRINKVGNYTNNDQSIEFTENILLMYNN